ncbi:MAG: TraB/GumN family protein [Spirochaetaceae bacterium]|jgi:uncharacterized protein YbaP (TraB family)|nr:TraB/GumN family protein [Spirochaetaceae bacterium]
MMKKFLLMAAVAFLCVNSAFLYGETSVWKISNGDNVLYLGGTIHLLRESDYPLPQAFEAAFEQSDILVFEASVDDFPASLNSGPVRAFYEECAQITAMMEQNDEIGRFVALTTQLNAMITQYENAYHSISDQTIPLTDHEQEIRGEIITIAFAIQKMVQREDIAAYLETARNILVLMQENDDLKFITNLMNPDYTSLEVIFSPELFGILASLCETYRYPLENIQFLKPYVAYSALETYIVRQFAKADGVDMFFQKKAKEYGKQIEYFETVEFQYDLLANLGSEYGESYYAYLFRELESSEDIEREFDQMADVWRRGEAIAILEDVLYVKEHFPAVYNAMIADRNNAWIPVIESYLKTRSVEFVLVGAAHLFGPDGLLPQLETKGYKIEQQ